MGFTYFVCGVYPNSRAMEKRTDGVMPHSSHARAKEWYAVHLWEVRCSCTLGRSGKGLAKVNLAFSNTCFLSVFLFVFFVLFVSAPCFRVFFVSATVFFSHDLFAQVEA